jgi:integrase
MASLHLRNNCENYIACYCGKQRTTGTTDRKLAQKIADGYEETARLEKSGLLNEGRVRKIFNGILERAGQDKIHSEPTENYLRDWLKGKDNEGTNERYSHTVDLFLEVIGEKKSKGYLSDISHNDVLKFIESRQGNAPATIRIDVKSLNIAFKLAKDLGFTEHNPVAKALAMKPITGGSMERVSFTIEQVKAIVAKTEGEWKTIILFGYFTGARITDCARMKWSNIDFAKKLLRFVAKKTGHKNDDVEVHTMPLAPELETHLLSIPSADDADTFITPELAAKDTRGRNGLSETFKRIMVAAGVDPQIVKGKGKKNFSRLSFHSLRHTCNSFLANAGVDQETRMKTIGWKSKDINDGYTHIENQTMRNALAKLPPLE